MTARLRWELAAIGCALLGVVLRCLPWRGVFDRKHPAVEGALMIARGEIKTPGVFSADGILEPDDFLPRLQKRGVELFFKEE